MIVGRDVTGREGELGDGVDLPLGLLVTDPSEEDVEVAVGRAVQQEVIAPPALVPVTGTGLSTRLRSGRRGGNRRAVVVLVTRAWSKVLGLARGGAVTANR